MRLIPRESARRRIAWTGRVASSSGNGLNCNEKVAPPSPSGGIEEREMEGGAMGPTGDNDDICDRTSGWMTVWAGSSGTQTNLKFSFVDQFGSCGGTCAVAEATRDETNQSVSTG